MRVAVVSTPFVAVPPRGYGGTELVVHELVRGLCAAGHDVTLFATGDSTAPDLRFLFPEPVWPPDAYTELLHCRAAAAEIAREGFDVVHAHAPALVAFASDLGAPVVYTLHHERDEALMRLYVRRPGVRYVAISARQAELHPELAPRVIHHGLDPARFPPGAGDGGYVAFLGRLSWCKAPDIAVEAARRARVPLRLAGEHHDAEQSPPGWKRQLDRALATAGVSRVGTVGGADKLALLGGARAMLVPLRWEEPFGLVMIEAMLCGTPVIAFPRGAAPEIVEEGVTGYLVRDAGEMARAIGEVRHFDRQACRKRAQARFSGARMASDYLRVYREAMQHAPVVVAGEQTYAG